MSGLLPAPLTRVLLSPLTAAFVVAGAALGLVLGAGVAGAVLGALFGVGLRVGAAYTRAQSTAPRIDPFALREPWRRYVQDALQAQGRFERAVAEVREGPLRDRLVEIGVRLDAGVEECWLVANRGQALKDARSHIRSGRLEAELAELDPDDPRVAAIRSQLDTAARLDRVLEDTRTNLSLLDARLDDAVARSLELSVRGSDPAALGPVDTTIDEVVDEMEALRLALEETDGGPSALEA